MGSRNWSDWLERADPDGFIDENDPYTPPDYRYPDGEPVPVDVVFNELFGEVPKPESPDSDPRPHRRKVKPPSPKQAGIAAKAAPWCSPDWEGHRE